MGQFLTLYITIILASENDIITVYDYPSPLWGAGKVEDTYNLLGHALRKAVSAIARAGQGREPAEIAELAGAPILNSSSLKTALDLNWDEPGERQNALLIILNSLFSVEE